MRTLIVLILLAVSVSMASAGESLAIYGNGTVKASLSGFEPLGNGLSKHVQPGRRHGEDRERSHEHEAIVRHHVEPRQPQELHQPGNIQTPAQREKRQPHPKEVSPPSFAVIKGQRRSHERCQ